MPRLAEHVLLANRLGLERPDVVVGLHVTMVAEPYAGPGSAALSDAERHFLRSRALAQEEGTAYAHVQRTRPATLAYALNDSPVGLAAWIVEKWREWSDCGGRLDRRFGDDDLLTTITLYWATQTIGTSFRVYRDWALGSASDPVAWPEGSPAPGGVDSAPMSAGDRIPVPAAVALFGGEWPQEWARRAYADLRRWTPMPRGGLFAAMEEPDLLAGDITAFFRDLPAVDDGAPPTRPAPR